MALFEEDLLRMAVSVAESAVSGAGEKSAHIVNNPDAVADLIRVVYDGLKSINDSMDGEGSEF